ncbi:hypothetical protein [Cryobacterium sp. Y62]|uniref:hypothetical protein n=1 Tax=Cryobacterium sp. Y62 TaxID=2048284 RepID=UPI0018ED83BB|nr:hypothetical protein [Cryobacterium sp. Y62]
MLRATLKRAGVDLGDLKAVHKQAAQIAAYASASRAPVVSGLLRRSIRAAGTRTAGIIRAGNNTRVPYAGVIHWGWKARGIPANPFLTNGAQSSESTWIRVYETYVDTTINQIQGK